MLINKLNLWYEFRDNLLQYNDLCFGRDSGFLAFVKMYSISVYFKEEEWRTVDLQGLYKKQFLRLTNLQRAIKT